MWKANALSNISFPVAVHGTYILRAKFVPQISYVEKNDNYK